jgi:hypothetical protein
MRITDNEELIRKRYDFFNLAKIVLDDTLLGGKRSSGMTYNMSFVVYRYDILERPSHEIKIKKVFVTIDYGFAASEPLQRIISALDYEPKYQMVQENYLLYGSLYSYIRIHPQLATYTSELDYKDLHFTNPIII